MGKLCVVPEKSIPFGKNAWSICLEFVAQHIKYVLDKKKNFFQKTSIWKYCCLEDIPRNELLEYLEKLSECNGHDRWLHIYENWLTWQNIEKNIRFNLIHCLAEIARITCISTSGDI